MEIYSDLTNKESKEFEKLLENQHSKVKIEEGKVISCTVVKITDKFVYLSKTGLKQEPVLDKNELKSIGLLDGLKENDKISVLLERLEHPKTGEIVVSAEKALKLEGWNKILALKEKEEPVDGVILRKCKGGAEVLINDLNLNAFLPGSLISDTPMKNFDHLIGKNLTFAIAKLDTLRGNVVLSRKKIISSHKAEDKKKIIDAYEIGTIVEGTCKQLTSFGAFFRLNDSLDVLCHASELSFSHISHPDEVVSVGDVKKLKIIEKNMDKLQLGVSLKSTMPNPFDEIDKYEVGKIYKSKISKITEFGFFADINCVKGLTALCHQSELSHTKKNVSAKKMFSVGQEVTLKLIEVDKKQKRLAASYKACLENPYDTFQKKYKINDIIEAKVVAKNEYSLFVKTDDLDLDFFCHCNNLTWKNNGEEELNNYKVGQQVKVKILEINIDQQKIRVGLREAISEDPINFFKDKKVNQVITVKIISTNNQGLIVRPEGLEDMDFQIKKSDIAINAADARPSRFTGGGDERIDVAIKSLDLSKRKVVLSIKLLEELDRAEALEKFGTTDSTGKSLPFSNLDQVLLKKNKKK